MGSRMILAHRVLFNCLLDMVSYSHCRLRYVLILSIVLSALPARADESPLPKRFIVGTNSMKSATHLQPSISLSPQKLAGEYFGESGDGVTSVQLSVASSTTKPGSWVVKGTLEERVAGQERTKRRFEALLGRSKLHWTFDAGNLRGVFAGLKTESTPRRTEQGLILNGTFLFRRQR